MNYSFLAIFIVALSLAGFVSLNTDNELNWATADEQSKTGQFMYYTYAFDDYYQLNPTANGDITFNVSLPKWLPKSVNIKMVIENGVGYVYAPATKGMMSEVLKWTNNSDSVGISDAVNINTVSGKIDKPGFIGSGYLVYVR